MSAETYVQRLEMSDAELGAEMDRFKRDIDLAKVLEHAGWTPGRSDGTERRGSQRNQRWHRRGEWINSGVMGSGIHVWWREGERGGTIVDYLVAHEGCRNVAEAGAWCRRYLGNASGEPAIGGRSPSAGADATAATRSTPDEIDAPDSEQLAQNAQEWATATLPGVQELSYTRRRGLRDDIVLAYRAYVRVVREAHHRNIAFGYPLIAEDGTPGPVIGFERRWFDPAGARHKAFSNGRGAKRGLWLSHDTARIDTADISAVVFAEATINALAFAQLFEASFSPAHTLLTAFGGNWTGSDDGVQAAAIAAICSRYPHARVLVATDNDTRGTGRKYLRRIQALVPRAEDHLPRVANDWADLLFAEQGPAPNTDPFLL